MKKYLLKSYSLIIISLLFISRCSDPISSPPDIPINKLLSAPETLEINNKSLVLKTSIYLNLMPEVSETPMIVPIYLETVDSSDIPRTIVPKSIYVVNKNKVWKSFFSNETPSEPELTPFRIIKIARNGPEWGPEIYVDVIVKLDVNRKSYLLRASKQFINAAY